MIKFDHSHRKVNPTKYSMTLVTPPIMLLQPMNQTNTVVGFKNGNSFLNGKLTFFLVF